MNKTRKIYVIVTICIALIASILLASCNTTTQSSLNQADTPDLIPIEYGSADVIENAPKLATLSATQFSGYSSDTSEDTSDDGIRYPEYYFEIPSAGTYELPVGGYDTGDGASLKAQYFGNLIPTSGDNGGRNGGKESESHEGTSTYSDETSRQLGWIQSHIFGGAFYTNIKLDTGLSAVAEAGHVTITMSCVVGSKYHYSRNTSGRRGFYATLGMSYTKDMEYKLLDGESQPHGNGGLGGTDFISNSPLTLGQEHSDDLYDLDEEDTNGTYKDQSVSWENPIKAGNTTGNEGIRLHYFLASDQSAGFYIANIQIKVDVTNPFEGAGTESNPYKIKNATDLQNMAAFVQYGNGYESAYYKQTADIDLGGISNFTPIGVSPASGDVPPDGIPFTGVYDGNGYKIKILP